METWRLPMILVLLLVASGILGGCAAPGTPMLRTSEGDGESKLIAGCNNVSANARVEKYINTSYLTTWGSALKEGASEGFTEQVEAAGSTMGGQVLRQLIENHSNAQDEVPSLLTPQKSAQYKKYNNLFSRTEPFCRYYSENYKTVAKATATVVKSLEHRPVLIDESLGVFETDFVDQAHSAARWRDRYVILLDKAERKKTVIKVFRIIYVSRSKSGNSFNLASSVGHNETWIMTRISDLLDSAVTR
ncbi:MAG: hypothetical protein GZ085_03710 [Sulfuriferula multivorans]|uniref:Lipoprotein n=1 Tax=Sulfuriferula multivorans TaxID=1559896 RepID=A0A7C9JVW1_9PROT|nr:hypothetical protein [Sulfuriferula multivorans]